MANKIEVTADPAIVTLVAGDSAEVAARIKNLGQTVDQLILTIEGIDSSWYTIPVSSVALFPNDEDTLKITVHPTAAAESQTGPHACTIKVSSQENPSETGTAELTVDIKPILEVDLHMSPERVRGRKGTYQIVVHNPGTNETKVNLRASDPRNRLRYLFNISSMSVDGGSRAGASLQVRLGWLAWIGGEKEFAFHVAAVPPGAEAAAAFCPYCGERLKPDPTGTRVVCPECGQNLVDGAKVVEAHLVRPALIRGLPHITLPTIGRAPLIESFSAATEDRKEYKLTWLVKRTKEIDLDGQAVPIRGEMVVYPAGPTTYTLTATNKKGSISQSVKVDPLPVPKPQVSERIKAMVAPDKLQTHAGTVPATAMVQLQNLGEIVDKFFVEVEGIDPGWYSRSAASVALMPQATDQVKLTFQPPKKQGVKSGTYPFAVTVRSESSPDDVTIVAAQMDIAPAPEFRLKIRPSRIICRRKGTFSVALNNTGVTDIDASIDALDLEDNCKFELKQGNTAAVGAWRTVELPMIVRPKRGFIIGEHKRFDVTVTATPGDGVAQTLNCELNHKPFINSWRTILRYIRSAIFFAGIVTAIWFAIHLGGGWDALTEDPAQWAEDLVNGQHTSWW